LNQNCGTGCQKDQKFGNGYR